MERRKLVKPQSTETLEHVAVYACEDNTYCPDNSGKCGSGCPCANTLNCP